MQYKKNILVIDDSKHIRDILWFSLKKEGYRAILAESGIRGLDLLFNGKEKIDLVLLDVMMPGMDGFATLRKIRANSHEASNIPVIMLTAKAQKMDVVQGLGAGANDYILKPYQFNDLLTKIQRLMK